MKQRNKERTKVVKQAHCSWLLCTSESSNRLCTVRHEQASLKVIFSRLVVGLSGPAYGSILLHRTRTYRHLRMRLPAAGFGLRFGQPR